MNSVSKNMASFLNHFRYKDDVEFRDLESGERSDTNIYPSLPPTYPTPDASMQIVQLSPADVKMQSNPDPNVKRSNYWHQADPTKVRIRDCHGQPWGFFGQTAPVPAETRTHSHRCGF